VAVDYPPAIRDLDLIHRPRSVNGGAVRLDVGGRSVLVRRRRGGVFSVNAPPGTPVTALRGRDRHGNVTGASVTLSR
jgi:hypothetical protein